MWYIYMYIQYIHIHNIFDMYIYILVGGDWNMTFIFPYIWNVIIPIDFHIFQTGWNHQPVYVYIQIPDDPCIEFLPRFGSFMRSMLVNIPYMDHLGYNVYIYIYIYSHAGLDRIRFFQTYSPKWDDLWKSPDSIYFRMTIYIYIYI